MRISPYDAETVMMLKSLTGRESFITEFDDHFTIHAFYSKHNDVDYINAIINAVQGRMGERYVGVDDNPGHTSLKFIVKYDGKDWPDMDGFTDVQKPDLFRGELFCSSPRSDEFGELNVRAIQVRRDNAITVSMFCGNGVLHTERHPGGKAWFTFLNNGIYVDVPENDYIVRRENSSAFEVWGKAKFETIWTRKG